MKKFFTSNWKRILYVICGLVIALDLVFILRTPNNVVNDFYRFGPKYNQSIIEVDVNGNEIINTVTEGTDTSSLPAKILIVIFATLIVCLFLDEMVNGKPKEKKK